MLPAWAEPLDRLDVVWANVLLQIMGVSYLSCQAFWRKHTMSTHLPTCYAHLKSYLDILSIIMTAPTGNVFTDYGEEDRLLFLQYIMFK